MKKSKEYIFGEVFSSKENFVRVSSFFSFDSLIRHLIGDGFTEWFVVGGLEEESGGGEIERWNEVN